MYLHYVTEIHTTLKGVVIENEMPRSEGLTPSDVFEVDGVYRELTPQEWEEIENFVNSINK